MTDGLAMWTCAPVTPLRKCEWCSAPSRRGGDLCDADLDSFMDTLVVPRDASPYPFACVFSVLAFVGVTL